MLIKNLFENPLGFLAFALALLIVLTVHEVSHGIVALWLGDSTAKDEGRLSFNPLAHLDPLGAILLLFVGFGWGKPVPVNYSNLKYPKWGPAIVSLAGPISNFIMLIIFGIVYKLVAPGLNPIFDQGANLMQVFLSYLIVYSAILGVFNLIPIPPLDGSKVLFAVLPESLNNFKYWLASHGPMLLFGLLILDSITGSSGFSVFSFIYQGVLLKVAQFF